MMRADIRQAEARLGLEKKNPASRSFTWGGTFVPWEADLK